MSKKYYLALPGSTRNSWKIEVVGLNKAREIAQKTASVMDIYEIQNQSRFVRIGTVSVNIRKNALWEDNRTKEVYELYKNGKLKLKLKG